MKRSKILSFILCLILVVCSVAPVAFAQEVTTQTQAVKEDTVENSGLNAVSSILGSEKLVDNAEAAILYELNSQTMMYALNADKQVYPSSLVKILTALITVEKGNVNDAVTVSEEALATVPYDAASVELQAGEVLTLGDLLYCMMVGSANDAAAVIAEHICGDQETFVQEMNRYAVELGCTATNFVNVHGLHDDAQVTTARDMGRILAAALKNETFREYFSTIYYTVPATKLSEERNLSSGNFLMNTDSMQIYYDARVTGGRTGIAQDGKRCIAVSAEKDNMEMICIVMGSESVMEDDGYTVSVFGGFKETTALLDAGFNGYKAVQILFPGQAMRQCNVVNGENAVVLGCENSVFAILPSQMLTEDLSYRYTDVTTALQAPITTGQVLSSVEVWYNGTCVARSDLMAMNDVRALEAVAETEEETKAKSSNNALTVLLIIVVTCLAVILSMRVYRIIRQNAAKNKDKRYRRNRRRSR